jgi:hypothetical protein
MGVYEEIFPTERRMEYPQTEWAAGWAAAAAGFGFAAGFLTKNARSLGATVDQAGLAIFFLQRHRVELILKNLLDMLGVAFPATHSLETLWDLCESGLEADGMLDWQEIAPHGELIAAFSRVDDLAATFRFPVDRKGEEMRRPKFIDLEALDARVEELYWDVYACTEALAARAAHEAEVRGEVRG